MFGHDWEHTTAKVIDRKLISSGGGETPGQHAYVVEIQNPTGESFRAKIQDPDFRGGSYVVAHVGEEVGVLVDYKRQKAKLDKDDPARHKDPKEYERAQDAKFESELAAPPGTSPDPTRVHLDAEGLKITINGKTVEGKIETESD